MLKEQKSISCDAVIKHAGGVINMTECLVLADDGSKIITMVIRDRRGSLEVTLKLTNNKEI